MVCIILDSPKREDDGSDTESSSKPKMDDQNLNVQRIAGGNVVKHPPIFSTPTGEILFIIWDKCIRAYSTITGEWIRDLEGSNERIIGHQSDPLNPKLLYACTENGEVIAWKWKSGVIHSRVKLNFVQDNVVVSNFTLIEMKDRRSYGLLTWRDGGGVSKVKIGVYDLSDGTLQEVKIPLRLSFNKVKMSVGPTKLNYFALIQDNYLHCVNYIKGATKSWKNARMNELTCIATHPTETLVATGDVSGRIFLWREIFSKCEPMTALYHWHHTTVNSIAFTLSGSHFYSGGFENVLVKWNQHAIHEREFVPRMWGAPLHIAVGDNNQKIAVAADDNEIQILDARLNPKVVIQNFTWVPNDKTHGCKFPIGLKVNPRNSSLVMNGRVGHLQFFSTHTKNLLYNMDTTIQNRLNIEKDKVLYNTAVTHASLNMNWLVTAELLDDEQHTIESRLKFWLFDYEKQTYSLNTQIELPHENGVKALEFSTPYSVENLLCASSGRRDVKIWALEDSSSIHKKGKIWICIGHTSYKDLPISSLSFSTDTSLLGVGFGNALCIYAAETLKLKCVLSAAGGIDGSTNKLTIRLPTKAVSEIPATTEKRAEFIEKKKALATLVKKYLENDDNSILKTLNRGTPSKTKSNATKSTIKLDKDIQHLTACEQKLLFNRVMALNSLNLFQKISILDKFNLHCTTPAAKEHRFKKYVEDNGVQNKEDTLFKLSNNLVHRGKYKSHLKLHQYKLRKRPVANLNRVVQRLIRFTIDQRQSNKSNTVTNGRANSEKTTKAPTKSKSNDVLDLLPVKCTTEIKHVVFCSGEFSHLIIACTENRILIWNLLTLRLKSSLKISVDRIVVDLYTSLVSVFTKANELYVFLPNTPLPLYQHSNLPKILGAAWIPRRHPKPHSLTVDWQAITELYLLSEEQELLRLVSSNDMESLNVNAAYLSETLQPIPYTPFAALMARQINNESASTVQDARSTGRFTIGLLGKASVKELTNLQTHTMAPVHLLCNGFLKSLLIDEGTHATNDNASNEDEDNDDEEEEEEDDNDGLKKAKTEIDED